MCKVWILPVLETHFGVARSRGVWKEAHTRCERNNSVLQAITNELVFTLVMKSATLYFFRKRAAVSHQRFCAYSPNNHRGIRIRVVP
jgi:hypothetical protein